MHFYRHRCVSSITKFLCAEYAYVQIHTPARNQASYLLLRTALFFFTRSVCYRAACSFSTVPCCWLFEYTWRPAHAAHEVISSLHHPHALSFLRQVPAADSFIVGTGEEVFATGMEYQTTDPIIMAAERLDADPGGGKDLDKLVPPAGSKVLSGA